MARTKSALPCCRPQDGSGAFEETVLRKHAVVVACLQLRVVPLARERAPLLLPKGCFVPENIKPKEIQPKKPRNKILNL